MASSDAGERVRRRARQEDGDSGPFPRLAGDGDGSPRFVDGAADRGHPRPVPCSRLFVVKKGSNALVIISGVIPAPQSATVSWWYAPANGAIETRMLPPSGSASRALRIELHDSVDDQLRVKTHKRWRATERRLHDDVARQHPLQDHHSRLAPHRRLHGPRFGLSPLPRAARKRARDGHWPDSGTCVTSRRARKAASSSHASP